MADNNDAQSVLDYWYNPEKGMKDLFHSLWFGGGPEQDNEQREKFGPLVSIWYLLFWYLPYLVSTVFSIYRIWYLPVYMVYMDFSKTRIDFLTVKKPGVGFN